MQDHKEKPEPCLTHFTFRTLTPPYRKKKKKSQHAPSLDTFFLVIFKTCSFLKLLGIVFYSLLANLTRNIKIAGHFYGLRDAVHSMKMRDCPTEIGRGKRVATLVPWVHSRNVLGTLSENVLDI
jgi:hypothetical protein